MPHNDDDLHWERDERDYADEAENRALFRDGGSPHLPGEIEIAEMIADHSGRAVIDPDLELAARIIAYLYPVKGPSR